MSDVFLFYLLTRLDGIQFVCVCVLVAFGVVSFVGFLGLTSYDNNNIIKKYVIQYIYIPIVAIILMVFVPSKEEAIFILAGSNIMKVVKSDDTKRIAGKSVEVFEKYLTEMLKEDKNDGNAK